MTMFTITDDGVYIFFIRSIVCITGDLQRLPGGDVIDEDQPGARATGSDIDNLEDMFKLIKKSAFFNRRR